MLNAGFTPYSVMDGLSDAAIIASNYIGNQFAGAAAGAENLLRIVANAGPFNPQNNNDPQLPLDVTGKPYWRIFQSKDRQRIGKVTGGHSLLNEDVKVIQMVNPPDANVVCEATVSMKTPDGTWVTKTIGKTDIPQSNTMFPTNWSAAKIQAEVDSAWARQE